MVCEAKQRATDGPYGTGSFSSLFIGMVCEAPHRIGAAMSTALLSVPSSSGWCVKPNLVAVRRLLQQPFSSLFIGMVCEAQPQVRLWEASLTFSSLFIGMVCEAFLWRATGQDQCSFSSLFIGMVCEACVLFGYV